MKRERRRAFRDERRERERERSGWSPCKCFFFFYKEARLRPGSLRRAELKAQGRPRARQAGVISSVISFHHYLVTNIV